MAGLKGVIFSLRGVLVQERFDRALFDRTIRLIRFLQSKDITPVFASNSRWSFTNGKPFEELLREELGDVRFYYGGENMDYKPRSGAVGSILETEGWSHIEAIYVGNSEVDMRTASTGRVMFLNALWHGEQNPYGFQFNSPEDIGRFIDCLCLRLDDWFWAVEDGDHRVYALGPFTTLSPRYAEAHGYSAGARATAKAGIDDDQFWGRLLAARVYLTGLVDEIDVITCYPGHKTTSGPPEVEVALSILAGSVRKKYLPDLIVRHANATKSQSARTAGRAVDIANQLSTIHLNERPRKGIGKPPYASARGWRGKTILVVDDFCTAGNSLEGARAFIEAAGAKMIGLAWLKTINTDYRARTGKTPVQNAYVPLTAVPTIPVKDICYTGHIRDQGVMRDLAETYGDYQRWSLS